MIKLLCTDMDRTLLPNGEPPAAPAALPVLRQLVGRAGLALAYVTGRDIGRVLQAVDEYGVPLPDYIIGDVGSSIYGRDGESFVGFPEWRAQIAASWQGRSAVEVHALIGADRRLTAQEPDRQNSCKQSYYLSLDEDHVALRDELAGRLLAAGFDSALVYSDDPERGVGLLDVLPAGATKLGGVRFLRQRLALEIDELMFAGDSGNDVDVLVSEIPAVLVGNADAGLCREVTEAVLANGNAAALFTARGNLSLPGGIELNGNYSAGIVEGLLHFCPSLRGHLEAA